MRYQFTVECDGISREDALENLTSYLEEANETTYGYAPVYVSASSGAST